MDALTQLLRQIGTDRFNDLDYQRATLAMLDRLDILQKATVATKRTTLGDVVDAAIAPDGRVFVVERKNDRAWLYEWIHAPLKSKFAGIATADFISLCGFPDDKTLAYATYSHDVGGCLHFGDWTSDPIPFRADDGAMFWECDGTIHVVARRWISSAVSELLFFRLPNPSPVHAVDDLTSNHTVLHGRLTFFARHKDGTTSLRSDLDPRVPIARFHAEKGLRLDMVRFPSPDIQPGAIAAADKRWYVGIGAHWSTVSYLGTPVISEGRLYFTQQRDFRMPGGIRPWQIEVRSVEEKGWVWYRDHVSALRGICYIPDGKHTVLLVDPNTKHRGDRLEAVTLDENGKEISTERIDGATGNMRRVGTVVIVEGRDEHGMTVSVTDGCSWMTYPLVGKFDRLSEMRDGLVGWHYAEDVFSVQRYG